MWIELGIARPGSNSNDIQNVWINTDHIVRVEFTQDTATVISTKPGGSDRSIYKGDDAQRIRLALNKERTWSPLLDFELPVVPDVPLKKKR